jgi:phage terminase large subunit
MTTALLERSETTTVRFEPRGGARELWSNRDALVLFEGPAGTGKSLAALWKLHMAALSVKLRGLIVRQTHLSLTSTTLTLFEEQVIRQALDTGLVKWFGGSSRQPAAYRYANGSQILVGGLDQPTKLLSSEYDRVIVDEANETSENSIETIVTRLRGSAPTYKQCILLSNPDAPSHWLRQRQSNGGLPSIQSRHRDNCAYYDAHGELTARGADYMSKLDQLTGVRRLRYRDGIWASAEGVIFDEFDHATHVVPLPTFGEDTRLCAAGLPWEWTRYWAIDFGYTNPTVIQRWAEDPDGNLWLYAEQYQSQLLVEDHVKDLKAQVQDERGNWVEPKPRNILADHDAEDRGTFHKHMGIGTQTADKRVKAGIDAVKSRLMVRPNGKPRLFIVEHSPYRRDPVLMDAKKPTSTVDEIGSYIWNTTKDAPVKEDDHGLDALRYVVANRDLRVKPSIRVMKSW